MLRREFLIGLIALTAAPSGAHASSTALNQPTLLPLGQSEEFSLDLLSAMARQMAETDYQPRTPVNNAWRNLSYDDYVSIWFNENYALWRGDAETPLEVDLFTAGLYYPTPIQVAVVENGSARRVGFSFDAFDKTDKFPDIPIDDTLGYSGIRLRAEIEKPGTYQEFSVFQGASYFRAIGTGNIYGLSARGLAIDTASPAGEEFPDFTHFWIEKPTRDNPVFIVHALLDSESCTGAYTFEIETGEPLSMDVKAEIFPRRPLNHVGIAPLTSMFQFDETNRNRFDDFRPAVHDSDGLLILNGNGEKIWRPLANPKTLQISAFQDRDPRGFGLMQRARAFSDFADLEALYHRRPGAWIEPKESWGEGAVVLVEIPTEEEVFDNIVSYWRPRQELQPGQSHTMTYKLIWGASPEPDVDVLSVLNTRIGKAAFGDGIIVTIDYEAGTIVPNDLTQIERYISASTGEVSEGVLQTNPETGGPRLAFRFIPGDAELIELRAQLVLGDKRLTEVWLYRWTA
ncbi:MAG: glucan biosynthesis protein G [Pseudomonadota bacterium]